MTLVINASSPVTIRSQPRPKSHAFFERRVCPRSVRVRLDSNFCSAASFPDPVSAFASLGGLPLSAGIVAL